MSDEAGLMQAIAWSQHWRAEDDIITRARAKAVEAGCVPVDPVTGAMLQVLAAAIGAMAVVEVGTGTGVSGTWILRGMAANGVLTTIDYEAEHQRVARTTFAEAAVAPQRTRVITGKAKDVLPRLTPQAYDMVVIDADEREHPDLVTLALPLLRSRGLLVVDDALSDGKVADPARRDAATVAVRGMLTAVLDDSGLTPVVLPVGSGLLIATVH